MLTRIVDQLADNVLSTSMEEPLARLVAFEPTTFPVLSVYLNTQPDQHGRAVDPAPYLHREFKAMARTWAVNSPEHTSFENDVERILAYIADNLDTAANGVAIFACWGSQEFFEAIQLTTPVNENRVYAYNQPHLYHLARLDGQYPRYAAVLTDTNTARIFVFGLGHVIDAEEVNGTKVHRVKVGGWSQARYQRRVGNAHQEHAKEVVEHLARIVRDDHVSHIILAGDSVVIPLIQEALPQEMVPMVEVMKLDIHSSGPEILTATLEKLREEEVRTASEKVARLLDEYRARGLAAVGLRDTLQALANGQVDELLISGALDTSDPLADLLVTRAKQTSAEITFVESSGLLDEVGGVGAFLRWRL